MGFIVLPVLGPARLGPFDSGSEWNTRSTTFLGVPPPILSRGKRLVLEQNDG